MYRNIYHVLFVFPLGVAALSVLYVPFAGLGLEAQKGTLVAFILGVTLLWGSIPIILSRYRLAVVFPKMAYAASALLVVSVVSAVFNTTPFGWNVFGLGFEMGTIGSFALFAALALVSALANRMHMLIFYMSFVGAVAVSGVASVVLLALGWSVSELVFFSWPQTSFIIVVALLVSSIGADTRERFSSLTYKCLVPLLSLVFLFFFHPTPALIGGLLLALASVFFLWASLHNGTRIPVWVPVTALFLLTLSFINFHGMSALPPDVRLAPSVTYQIGGAVYTGDIARSLFGVGPDGFSTLWDKHRPAEFNQTPLWNTTFREGFSTASTWVITLGFFGLLAYILCPLAVVYKIGLASWMERGVPFFNAAQVTAVLLVTFVFLSGALYVIDIYLFLIGAVALGFFSRLFVAQAPPTVQPSISRRLITASLLICLGTLFLVVSVCQVVSSYAHAQGVEAFNSREYVRAKDLLLRSVAFWPASMYLRDASRVVLEDTHLKATYPDADRTKITEGILQARQLARSSALAAPEDYSARLAEGSLLTSLVIAGLVELGPEAESVLRTASTFSPTRPDTPYIQALLSNALGSSTLATSYVQEALQRKPDYAEAKTLFEQLSLGVAQP